MAATPRTRFFTGTEAIRSAYQLAAESIAGDGDLLFELADLLADLAHDAECAAADADAHSLGVSLEEVFGEDCETEEWLCEGEEE